MSPLCESFLTKEELDGAETYYPLHVYVCDKCFLVQLNEYVGPESIFREYAYFSGYSSSWVEHAKTYCAMITRRLQLDDSSLAVELASNDGYLLQHFAPLGVPALGIEPALNVAEAAREKGVETVTEFFGEALARQLSAQGRSADLIIGNNVLAQVPNVNDFVEGIRVLLKPEGVVTLEFPHLEKLIDENQFDTIYHEHFSYFSLTTVEKVFAKHDLCLFDVEELATHGGSLRIYARHAEDRANASGPRVAEIKSHETTAGLTTIETYSAFAEQVRETKRALLELLITAKREGKQIVGYGAPAKGNTLLNYCGIRQDFLDYTVDRSPHKQGRFLPGTHIPVYAPEKVDETKPDYILILPWNLKDEIMAQMIHIREWGGKFVVPIPYAEVLA